VIVAGKPIEKKDLTNAELAEQIAGVTHVSAGKVEGMCRTKAEKNLLVHLLWIARSNELSSERRAPELEKSVRQLADLILKVVRHIHGLTGLPTLREAEKTGTNDELASAIRKATRLKPDQIRNVAPRRSDKTSLIALLDITYSRMSRDARKAALRRQIADLAYVILRLVKHVL
jgi:hypothetical protein